jgi:molybdate transport system substrate-binding protein
VKQIVALGSSGVGVAVRAGARKPDISTEASFIRALTDAQSVAHSKVGASGIYFSELLENKKISLKKRIIVEKGPVGLAVARGEAELGIQQLCELAPVAGIDIVGPLPAALQRLTHFAVAIPVDAPHPENGRKVLEILQSVDGRRAMNSGEIKLA